MLLLLPTPPPKPAAAVQHTVQLCSQFFLRWTCVDSLICSEHRSATTNGRYCGAISISKLSIWIHHSLISLLAALSTGAYLFKLLYRCRLLSDSCCVWCVCVCVWLLVFFSSLNPPSLFICFTVWLMWFPTFFTHIDRPLFLSFYYCCCCYRCDYVFVHAHPRTQTQAHTLLTITQIAINRLKSSQHTLPTHPRPQARATAAVAVLQPHSGLNFFGSDWFFFAEASHPSLIEMIY